MTTPEREVAQVVRATRRAKGLQWLNGALLAVGAGVFGWFVLGDRAGHQPGASVGDALTPSPDSREAKAPSEQRHPRGRA